MRAFRGPPKPEKGLSVSADALVFEEDERGPDEDLELQFEALSQFDSEENRQSPTPLPYPQTPSPALGETRVNKKPGRGRLFETAECNA
jgi:hypothetical protein